MSNGANQRLVVWWVLWAAFQSGVFVVYHCLGGTGAGLRPASADSLLWVVGLGPVGVSTLIRWLLLARAANAQVAFPLFVLGIALAEASCFLGLFLFPAHRQELFLLSALGIFQFVPVFARRFFQ